MYIVINMNFDSALSMSWQVETIGGKFPIQLVVKNGQVSVAFPNHEAQIHKLTLLERKVALIF